jgi:asparagine synthase (glutamine-hydrolysing)
MTLRGFLAFAGAPEPLARMLSNLVPSRQTPPQLNRIFEAGDLVVFASPETEYLLFGEDRGLLIGRLFRGVDPGKRVETLSLSESRHAGWSGGKSLLSDMWGGYAALLRDDGKVVLLRDPSGAIPVHLCAIDDVHCFFSHAELAQDLGLEGRDVDEEFLRQWLSFPFLRTKRTGIAGVEELLPGTSRTVNGDQVSIAPIWTPWKVASTAGQFGDFEEAARQVRAVALGTVGVQLAGLGQPILELSGGLDSSIVAACLAAAGQPFRAVNFATSLPDGDERDYARIVANALGVRLAEIGEDPRALDLGPGVGRGLRPSLSPVLQPLNRAFAVHAQHVGADHFVTGAGGDNLFCYLTTATPFLDATRALGLAKSLGVLRDVAELGNCTIWTALNYAIRKRLALARRPVWKRDERFLAPKAVAAVPDDHPWLDAPHDMPPGKVEHVVSLVRAQHFLEPEYPSGEAIIHPLLNQPLIELCLSIPTWFWLRGGRNRAVARAAFADLLPEEIILRRTKGRLESMCARAYETNRERLAGLLLDGELAKRGLLDLSRLESYLRVASPPRDVDYFRIFDLASLELWLRS